MCKLFNRKYFKDDLECIEEIKKTPIYKHIIFEASGDITEENLKQWSQTGVDILSIGALTHSSHNFNLSMRIV